METLKPSDLLALAKSGVVPDSTISLDTETSGLFPDDGARVGTVSIAWEDDAHEWDEFGDRLTIGEEVINPQTGLKANIVSVAWPFAQGKSGKPEDNGQETLWPEAENLSLQEWRSLAEWLNQVGGHGGFMPNLIMHPLPYDSIMMRAGAYWWPDSGVDLADLVAWDTMAGLNLLYPLLKEPGTFNTTMALKPACSALFEETVTDEQDIVKRYLKKARLPSGRWDLVPWDIIGPYADQDARLTKRLEMRQVDDVWNERVGQWLGSPADVLRAMLKRVDASKACYRMEVRGLPYDEVESRLAGDECLKRAKKLEEKLPFDPPTADTAKSFFFTEGVSKRGIDHIDMVPYGVSEKTGEPSLTAEILARMVEDNVPYADQWAEYTKVQTAASMWYHGYADKMGTDGRLRTRFRVFGTKSSRFSASRVNLQAIPQDYRLSDHSILAGIHTPQQLIDLACAQLSMAGRRWKRYELDLDQAELRVGAMFANEERMLEMIRNNEDLHTFTTKALFPDEDPDGPQFKSKWRQVGKRGNFSLGFGAGWDTFRRMVSKETGIRLADTESMRIVREWNNLYPAWSRAIDRHSSRVAKRQAKYGHGWVDLVTKERRWFDKYEETHKAFNQRVQANLAQFGLEWLHLTDEYLRGQGLDEFNAGLILTVHDSQMLLLPDDEEGQAMADKCAQFGRDLWAEWFPGVPGGVSLK